MLKRTLILLVLGLVQSGCYFDYGDRYTVAELSAERRTQEERMKRELLQLEDVKIGDGPIAAWGRKIAANVEVRYSSGTLVYAGPIFTYAGFVNMPELSITERDQLGFGQHGIRLGLNGMAIGGRRRIIVDRQLVCSDERDEPNANITCLLVGGTKVRKERLIVEATLTQSCIPIQLIAGVLFAQIDTDIWCRTLETPRLNSTDPIWHFYGQGRI